MPGKRRSTKCFRSSSHFGSVSFVQPTATVAKGSKPSALRFTICHFPGRKNSAANRPVGRESFVRAHGFLPDRGTGTRQTATSRYTLRFFLLTGLPWPGLSQRQLTQAARCGERKTLVFDPTTRRRTGIH